MFSKFEVHRKESGVARTYFLEELKELVLPVHQIMNPENALIETPHDDRFKIAQGLDSFIQKICEVNLEETTGTVKSNEGSPTMIFCERLP